MDVRESQVLETKRVLLMLEASNKIYIGSRHRVRVERLGSRAEGIAHVLESIIFIPKTFPGDEVDIEIISKEKSRYRAKVIQWIMKSDSHHNVFCRHFYECGGCDLQGLDYSEQIRWKRNLASHWLNRSPLAKYFSPDQFEVLESPVDRGYRHRVRLQGSGGKPAFTRSRSHDLLPIDECPVLVPGFFDALQSLASTQRQFALESFSYANDKIIDKKSQYKVGDFIYQFTQDSFTQGNLFINEKMIAHVQNEANTIKNKKLAIDYYCGIGNFSLPLSGVFDKVIGVESEAETIRVAKLNSKKVEWIQSTSHDALHLLRMAPDLVLLDPPRSGSLSLCRTMVQHPPSRIIYVSCQIASLIRDLTPLVKSKKFMIRRWLLVDLFPQTKHLESIVTLDRIEPNLH